MDLMSKTIIIAGAIAVGWVVIVGAYGLFVMDKMCKNDAFESFMYKLLASVPTIFIIYLIICVIIKTIQK